MRSLLNPLPLQMLAIALSAPAPVVATDPTPPDGLRPVGFSELAPGQPEALRYEAARTRGVEWLLRPDRSLDPSMTQLAGDSAAHLSKARFLVAANADADRHCLAIRASLFVLTTTPGTIYICADTRWNVLHTEGPITDILAQGFIHEAVHLAGTADECRATALELRAARHAEYAPNDGNIVRYSEQCGKF